MVYILVFVIGVLFGMIILAITTSSEISNLQEESYNAEKRALIHFRKLFKIENIIKQAEKDKTPSVIVLDKIKEVIQSANENNF